MKLTSRADNFNDGVILGVEYTLPNGLKKHIEEHVSYEARYKIDPKHFANKLFAMAEQDIRRNMATVTNPQMGQMIANNMMTGGYATATYTAGTTATDAYMYGMLQDAYNMNMQGYVQQQAYTYGWGGPPITRVLRFFRINTPAEIIEGGKFAEPLDELRCKVAKWLRQ